MGKSAQSTEPHVSKWGNSYIFLNSQPNSQIIEHRWPLRVDYTTPLVIDSLAQNTKRPWIELLTSQIYKFIFHQHWFHIDSITLNHNTQSIPTKHRVAIFTLFVSISYSEKLKWLNYKLNQCWMNYKLNVVWTLRRISNPKGLYQHSLNIKRWSLAFWTGRPL